MAKIGKGPTLRVSLVFHPTGFPSRLVQQVNAIWKISLTDSVFMILDYSDGVPMRWLSRFDTQTHAR